MILRKTILASDGSDYIRRWYLSGKPQPTDGTWQVTGPEHYIHQILQSDDTTRGLHNHPWRWAISIIIWRGYYEDRLDLNDLSGRHVHGIPVRRRRFWPGMINIIRETDFHRIELVNGKPAWTLFLTGPRIKGWGFLTRLGYVARRA
jgi:hypothetical protein